MLERSATDDIHCLNFAKKHVVLATLENKRGSASLGEIVAVADVFPQAASFILTAVAELQRDGVISTKGAFTKQLKLRMPADAHIKVV